MTRVPKPAETDVGSGRQPAVSDAAGRGIPCAELNWENEGGRLRRPQQAAKTYPAPQDMDAPERLAAEHADLLRNVVARADDMLATAATSRWPERELADLIDYLRSELITQTRIEEQLLFANAEHSSSEAMSRLARDHVRLRWAPRSTRRTVAGCDGSWPRDPAQRTFAPGTGSPVAARK